MTEILESLHVILTKYSLVTAFAVIGVTVWISYFMSERLTPWAAARIRHRHSAGAAAGLVWRNQHRRRKGCRRH